MNLYEWKALPVYLKKYEGVEPNIYFCNMAGQISRYNNTTNTYEILHQINAPTRACVGVKCYGKQKEITVKVAIMLTFSYRDDYESHNVINLNKNLYDNNINNLVWDDYTRFNKKLLFTPAPIIETLPGEIWSPIPNIGYTADVDTFMMFCSTYGRIYSYNKYPTFMNPEICNGYYRITIDRDRNRNGKRVTAHKLVHRIVMNTFNYNPNWKSLQVNHIDGNKINNNISNLEWCTPLENTHHSRITKLNNAFGENHPLNTHTTEQVIYVLDRYLNGDSLNIISNESDLSRDFVSHIISGNLRLTEIVPYMVNHDYVPSKLFAPNTLIEIIKECNDKCDSRDFRSIYKKFNIKRNTPEYISITIIYSLIYNCIKWIKYIEL